MLVNGLSGPASQAKKGLEKIFRPTAAPTPPAKQLSHTQNQNVHHKSTNPIEFKLRPEKNPSHSGTIALSTHQRHFGNDPPRKNTAKNISSTSNNQPNKITKPNSFFFGMKMGRNHTLVT
jgi:hypothetical protein